MFRLAQELGMSVSRIGKEVSSREFAEWLAFFSIESKRQQATMTSKPKSTKTTNVKALKSRFKSATGIYNKKWQ